MYISIGLCTHDRQSCDVTVTTTDKCCRAFVLAGYLFVWLHMS